MLFYFYNIFIILSLLSYTYSSIIIIGSGLTGLTIYNTLLNYYPSKEILILEGRSRIGGRINTELLDNIIIDLGCLYNYGINTTLYDYINSKQIILKSKLYNNIKTYNNDILINNIDDYNSDDLYNDMIIRINILKDNKVDTSLLDSVNSILSQLQLDNQMDILVKYKLILYIRQLYGEELSKLSMLYYDSAKPVFGADSLIPSGWISIVNFLSVGANIKLNSPVTSIDWTSVSDSKSTNLDALTYVTVADGTVYSANQVIVTVPISIIKSPTLFKPALPDLKLNALNFLTMGCLNRIYLHFPTKMDTWGNPTIGSLDSVLYLIDDSSPFVEFLNMENYLNQTVLMASTSGNLCRNTEFLSDIQITNALTGQLNKIFPLLPLFNVSISRWTNDPYSLGSFANFGPQWSNLYFKDLIQPLGRNIYFAGDAFSLNYPNTAHGAYENGVNVANAVANFNDVIYRVSAGVSINQFSSIKNLLVLLIITFIYHY